jgi:hypothetical protein
MGTVPATPSGFSGEEVANSGSFNAQMLAPRLPKGNLQANGKEQVNSFVQNLKGGVAPAQSIGNLPDAIVPRSARHGKTASHV